MVLRWIHLGRDYLGGLLYFFNLVNTPFLKEPTAQQRGIVIPKLMPRALWWFRWSSVVTVLVGIAYWNHAVAVNALNAPGGQFASVGAMMGSFFVIWTLAFAVENGDFDVAPGALRKGPGIGRHLWPVVIIAAGYVFLRVNEHGWRAMPSLAIASAAGWGGS